MKSRCNLKTFMTGFIMGFCADFENDLKKKQLPSILPSNCLFKLILGIFRYFAEL